MLGEEYVQKAHPEKVWCLLNAATQHEEDAANIEHEPEYGPDLEDLAEYKTSVAQLLVDHYSEGFDTSSESVRDIEIPYKHSLPDEKRTKAFTVEELLKEAEDTSTLLIAGRDAVSLYQKALGYRMKGENISPSNKDAGVISSYQRVDRLSEYAEQNGDLDMAQAVQLGHQNVSNEEFDSFVDQSKWSVNPKNVDNVDLRIWNLEQLEGPPFTSYPTPEEIMAGTASTDGFDYSWEIG